MNEAFYRDIKTRYGAYWKKIAETEVPVVHSGLHQFLPSKGKWMITTLSPGEDGIGGPVIFEILNHVLAAVMP